MKTIRISKLTLNIGSGTNTNKLEKGIKLIHQITGRTPVKTFTTKRIPTWGVRPGLPLGCKLTVRKNQAKELLAKFLQAKESKLAKSQFDQLGNIAFGVPEYIEVPGAKYDPDIGILLNKYARAFIAELDPDVQELYAYKNAQNLVEENK